MSKVDLQPVVAAFLEAVRLAGGRVKWKKVGTKPLRQQRVLEFLSHKEVNKDERLHLGRLFVLLEPHLPPDVEMPKAERPAYTAGNALGELSLKLKGEGYQDLLTRVLRNLPLRQTLEGTIAEATAVGAAGFRRMLDTMLDNITSELTLQLTRQVQNLVHHARGPGAPPSCGSALESVQSTFTPSEVTCPLCKELILKLPSLRKTKLAV